MTSKLKCPFCQRELERDNILGNSQPLYYCKNRDCERTKWLSGTPEFWQALIQAKQDLEIATKALEDIVSDYEVDASNGWLAANAKQALEQIKHKEK